MFSLCRLFVIGFWLLVASVVQSAEFSPGNANWDVFTNRDYIKAIAFSDDGKTLWVATTGGLEQRNATTKQLEKLFTHAVGGLPSNFIYDVVTDGEDGLWLGTGEGLAHLSSSGEWTVFNVANSDLPFNDVQSVVRDSNGGVWAGTGHYQQGGGLAYLSSNGQWTVYNISNSNLPSNTIYVLASDENNGVWIGTENGLAHLNGSREWQVFNTTNSKLPNNRIGALMGDGRGGVWAGTGIYWIVGEGSGLAHLDNKGEWTIFNSSDSGLPSNTVNIILSDGKDGLWIGTEYGGLARLTNTGEWKVFRTNNSDLPSNLITTLVNEGGNELLVGTGGGGFASLNGSGKGSTFSDSVLPSNGIWSILNDGSGGIWIGTYGGGLIHLTSKGKWTLFNPANSKLPGYSIWSIAGDGNGGLWLGMFQNGLVHLSSSGQWTIFNTTNSSLPTNEVSNALLDDGNGGVWIGTYKDGLAHLSANSEWTVFNTDNSSIPSNDISALSPDGSGGLWIGTRELWKENNTPTSAGLAHLKSNGEWEVFNTTNSILPNNNVSALFVDNKGGLWIGNGTPGAMSSWDEGWWKGNLTYLGANGEWKVFYTANSELPDGVYNFLYQGIKDFIGDGSDGLWMGTYGGGLAHLNNSNEWTLFNTGNSNLPSDTVMSLVSDGSGGLWVATLGGLTHLTFTRKTALCQQNEIACQALQTNKRAAIIIAGGGAHYENALWDTTEFISNKLYSVLNGRGFDNDEIYYLTPKSWADFNGDGLGDNIVDAPKPERSLIVEDIKAAFDWAKSKGKLDMPLYLFFIDHGKAENLQLSKIDKITASEFKAFLDDYQMATGNNLILLIDACFSGTFSQQLTDSRFRRALISSTNDTLAYFNREEKQGFSRSFAKSLEKGMSFKESFDIANKEQQKLLGNLAQLTTGSTGGKDQKIEQIPQLNEGSNGEWLGTHYLNNLSTTTGDDTLAIESATTSSTVQVGQPVTLTAKTAGTVSRAWAIVRPPKMNLVLDTSGTPILAYPRVILISDKNNTDTWQTTWNDAVYNGNYSVTFYAEDRNRNVVSGDDPLTLTVIGGIDPPPQAQVHIQLDKTRYQRGEQFKATLTEDLGWGYDLYAAVVMPDGNYFTLKDTNELRGIKEAKPWYVLRKQGQPITLLDLTLPTSLPTGQYCLYGILSPEQNDVFEAMNKNLWVYDEQCFEVF